MDEKKVTRKCHCTKTRCLKNYCECFKVGLVCGPECICTNCCNQEPLFLTREAPSQSRCKCQKSHCLKKYCECYSAGKKCTSACQCTDCENKLESNQYLSGPPHQLAGGYPPIDNLLSLNI